MLRKIQSELISVKTARSGYWVIRDESATTKKVVVNIFQILAPKPKVLKKSFQ